MKWEIAMADRWKKMFHVKHFSTGYFAREGSLALRLFHVEHWENLPAHSFQVGVEGQSPIEAHAVVKIIEQERIVTDRNSTWQRKCFT